MLVAKPHSHSKGGFYDNLTSTNDRGHEGAESLAAYAKNLHGPSGPIRKAFRKISGTAWAVGNPHLSIILDQR